MSHRLLAFFAHPDDESYGPAGTIGHAASLPGGKVRIVTATRGEAGSLGISRSYSPAELARIRQRELLAAARILGAEVAILGWPDKGVTALPMDPAVAALVREIRLFRPDVVMTFHPNGLSAHPDHRAMTTLTRAAWERAADPGFHPRLGPPWAAPRLLYYSVPESMARAIAHFRRIESIPDHEVDLALAVSHQLRRKDRACLAHVTQRAFREQLEGAVGGLEAYWSTEHFLLGGWHGSPPARPLTSLFATAEG